MKLESLMIRFKVNINMFFQDPISLTEENKTFFGATAGANVASRYICFIMIN